MRKYFRFCLVSIFLVLSSCTGRPPHATPGSPNNSAGYAAPAYTPRPIPTPLPKSKDGEVVLLLRKRMEPFEVLILRLPIGCLLGGEVCDSAGNLLGVLPQGLSQVADIYWTNDGSKAFFWDDNTTNIYVLEGNQGTFQVFKKKVLKVTDNFAIAPNGNDVVFEIQKGDQETDLISMNVNSGDITQFDIPEPCAKYISQWMDDNSFLFWCEKSEGKGYLVDVKVYTFNTVDHSVQSFEIGRDWRQTTVPQFSPNKAYMAFNTATTLVIRSVSNRNENALDLSVERFLWSTDSKLLVIYSQNKDIFTVRTDGSDLQKPYSLPANEYLEDWMWLPDNEHIFLITTDDDGNRRVGVLSVVDKIFAALNLSLLNDYDPVSISFRP